MKIRPVGFDLSLQRWMRPARRLGALGAFIACAVGALAQTLGVTTLAGTAGTSAPFSNVAPGTFFNPFGVAVDTAGNAYIADTSNHVIRRITSAGVISTLVGSVANSGTADDSTANAPAARFNAPRGVAINAAGSTLYVADTANNSIRVVNLASIGGAVTGVSTLVPSGTLALPIGIAINPAETSLYVADTGNHVIRSVALPGGALSVVAGLTGTSGAADGNSSTATFNSPYGVAVNSAGTALFVADYNNHLIRRVALGTVAVSTYAGIANTPGSGNSGVGTSATFRFPAGVALDSADNLYVADFGNNAIRLVAASGTNAVSTPAGGTAGNANGTGSAAQFLGPIGIAVKTLSGIPTVFVADTNNQLIRKAAAPALPVVGSPANQSAAVGANGITFTATVTGGFPTPTLQWQRQPGGVGSFVGLSNDANYSGVTTGTLTVNGVTLAMNGDKFKLVATSTSGTAESATPATLTVTTPATAPTFPTSTVTFTATVGQLNTFPNAASGSTPITYSVTSGSLGIFSLNPSTGTITGTPSSSADSVTATITASNGTLPNATRTVTINAVLTSLPTISVQPQPQTVAAGANSATFSVSASATPAITGYQWERQVGGVGSFTSILDGITTGVTFSGATTATLNLTTVAPSLNGDVFRVLVTNGTGTTTSGSAVLTVQGTVPQASAPSGVATDIGLNATFTSIVSGNPTPTLRWQRQAAGTIGFFDLSEGPPYSGTTTGTLAVAGVSAGMNGDQFRLTATNAHGSVQSGVATLAINSLVPVITAAPQNTTVTITQNASFTATAAGSPTPSLRWQRQPAGTFGGFTDLSDDGTYFGTTSNSLTIVNTTAAMNGDQFRVVASNTNGSSPSTPATLTVSSTAPTITANPASVIANLGQNVTFAGNATGVPSPILRWQRQPAGTTGFVDLSDDGTYSGTSGTVLTVLGVTSGMNGDVFRLVASNTGGSVPSNSAVLTVNLGTTITTLAGLATVPGSVDGTGASARFNSPATIVVDSSGTFYIADTANSVIRKMTANGVVTTIAGLAGSRGSVDGVGSAARFNSPTGIAVDSIGNVYVADTFSHTIRLISTSGVVTTVAGSPSASGALDGVGSAARFFLPSGIAVTAGGTLYVSDTSNHAIRRITSDGTVTTIAGTLGVPGFFDSSIGTSARFNAPSAIVIDSAGTLYVADSQNNAIRKISTSGAVSTLAGSLGGLAGSTDGTGSLATFNRPSGLAVDATGTVYVADTNNNTIRRVASTGEVTTLAGQPGSSGTNDGVGNAARFNRPFGIVVDTNGNLYVSDTGNHTIRRSGTTSPAQIVTQPVNRGAALGGPATFSVVATGSPAPSSYQWQRQAAGTFGFLNLANDFTYSGVNTTTLTVSNATSLMNGDQFRVIVANGVAPAATSDVVTLSIGTPPTFTSATSATFQAGQSNSFTVTTDSTMATTFTATGLPSWASLDSTTGVLSGNPPDTTGSPFSVILTANNGVPATQALTLTVLPANLPPTITTPPASTAVNLGQGASFNVAVGGSAPFTYQWRRNGVPIAGATSAALTLPNVQASSAGVYSVVVTNAAGSVTSGATLIVNTIPVVTAQPRSQVALAGGSVTFDVAATGASSFTYQWRKNGVALAGANGPTLTLNGITAADAGNYDVVVGDASGSVNSSLAQLTLVGAASAPVFTAQPAPTSLVTGTTLTLSAAASGAPAPTYQWRKNGLPIVGANGSTYVFANAQAGESGSYDVLATNAAGSVTSATAVVRVLARSYAGTYFGTFSGGVGTFALYVRDDNTGVFLGYVPGANAPVLGLNLTVNDGGQFSFNQGAIASATSTNADEPARAAALAPVAVNGSIANDGTVSGSIIGGTNATLSGARASDIGATQGVAGFYQAGAATNAAAAYTIAGGNGQAFVVVLSGTNSDGGNGSVNASGQVNILTSRSIIAESINGAAGLITGSATGGVVVSSFSGASDVVLSRQRLVNISSRARVGTGDAVAIAGFVISGTESKPVLIRAVGPTLGAAPFNVGGALASPRLELFRGTTSLGVNSGIASNRAAIDAAGAQAGAFALGAAGTDAAILTTLAPGNYTAVVSSATNTAGVALVEVYDLSGATAGQKLLNIATRASAGTGDNTLIAGFVVPPGASKRVLIRGVGPGLTPFGVTGVLAQPTLLLMSGSTTIAQNTNWTTSTDAAVITSSSAQVGAFGLAANDSALVVTLAPGNYTTQVVGAGGATGVALIEVYELP